LRPLAGMRAERLPPKPSCLIACSLTKAVVLDLVQPQPAGGRLLGLRRKAGRDEAGTQHGAANRACRPAQQDDPRPERALKAGGARDGKVGAWSIHTIQSQRSIDIRRHRPMLVTAPSPRRGSQPPSLAKGAIGFVRSPELLSKNSGGCRISGSGAYRALPGTTSALFWLAMSGRNATSLGWVCS
jgi:hypothetical protein